MRTDGLRVGADVVIGEEGCWPWVEFFLVGVEVGVFDEHDSNDYNGEEKYIEDGVLLKHSKNEGQFGLCLLQQLLQHQLPQAVLHFSLF
jgi:hypothetical protein